MKKAMLICVLLLFPTTAFSASYGLNDDVHVQGYTRQEGTYVQPHYRTSPDNDRYNNYSSPNNQQQSYPYTQNNNNEYSQPQKLGDPNRKAKSGTLLW